ncbi:MAG: cadherin-like domain-containing protein, partial [Thermodesulfobacteriota bacterium]
GELSRGYRRTAPVITGQVVVIIDEDTPREIVLADLIVTDADSTFPDDFTLMVQDGVNYTHAGNTITPALNFNGPLSVNVQVHDGGYTSNTYNLGITVTAVEDVPPVVSDIPDQTIVKGGAFTAITLDDYVADPQDDDSAIVWTATGNVELTVTITDRVVTVSAPDMEWTGTETVTFRATNTNDLFAEDAVVFTVNDESQDEPTDDGGGGGGGSCFISTTGFDLFR